MISHYDVLGIKETADRGAIRAAYLKRIKSTHPDRPRATKSDSERATAINLAYFTLRDPRRRLAHDLELRRTRTAGDGQGTADGPNQVMLRNAPPPPPPRPRSKGVVATGAILSMAIVGLALLVADLNSRSPGRLAQSAIGEGAPPARTSINPWVDRAMVDEAVDQVLFIRARGRAEDARAYSRDCFQLLDRQPSALLLDHCLSFDLAAARWRQSGMAEVESEFAPMAMRVRHAAALQRLDIREGGGERLRELSFATSVAIARRLARESPPRSETGALDSASADALAR